MPESATWEEAAGLEQPKELSWEEAMPDVSEQQIRTALGGPTGPIPSSPEELAVQRLSAQRMSGFPSPGEAQLPGQAKTYTLPGGSKLTTTAGQIGFPYLEPPTEAGTPEKIAAGIYNVAASIPNFLASPEGIGTAITPGLLPARIASPLLRGTFMGLMAKTAGEQAGVASVTKDPREITEAIGAAAFIPAIARAERMLPQASREAAISVQKGIADASKIQEAATVYGDVPTQPVQGPREVSFEEGRPGIRQGQVPQEGQARVLLEPTVTETTPPVPESEMPTTPTETGFRPAIRLVGGDVAVGDAGMTHPDIINEYKIPAKEIDQRGFVDQQGRFQTRETVAQATGLPTQKEPGRQHSTDLPESMKSLAPEPTEALRAGEPPTPDKILKATPEEFTRWKSFAATYGPQQMRELALQVKPSQLPKLIAERDALRKEVADQLKAVERGTLEERMKAAQDVGPKYTKAQTLNELIENAPLSGLPEIKPGTVRLYHGEGGAEGAGVGGSHFSTDPQYAANFGPRQSYVDVPRSVYLKAAEEGHLRGQPRDLFLDDAWVRKAKPIEKPVPMTSFDLDTTDTMLGRAMESRAEAGFVGKALAEDAIWNQLEKKHGIKRGGVVRVFEDSGSRLEGELLYDKNGKPIGIRLNQARIYSEAKLDRLLEHEAGHWFDLENADLAARLRDQVTPKEWDSISSQVERLKYGANEVSREMTARSIERLAQAWRGRNWFEKLVGNVQRFASETIGIKLTRKAAESSAIRALKQSIRRISEATPKRPDVSAAVEAWKQRFAQKTEAGTLRSLGKTAEMFLPPEERGKVIERGVTVEVPEEARRLKITPLDVEWTQRGKEGAYRPISDAEAANPQELGKILTTDARIEGSELPVSSTRRLVVMMDRRTGEVHIVSTYPTSRAGAMVVDPKKAGSARPNVPVAELLDRYKPLYSILRDSPVKNFHQKFDGIDDYMIRFGEEASQRSQESLGEGAVTAPVGTTEGMVEPVYPGGIDEPFIPTDAELKAFHNFFEGEIPETKLDFDRLMATAAIKGTRQMANAVNKAYLAEHEANPKASREVNIESALEKLYEDLKSSETRTAFVQQAEKRIRSTVAGPIQEGGIAAGIAVEPGKASIEGSFKSIAQDFRDELEGAKAEIGEGISNWSIADRMAYTADNVGNIVNNKAKQFENSVRMASVKRAVRGLKTLLTESTRGDPQVLAAANVLLQSNFDATKINTFREMVNEGIARATERAKSGSWKQRRLAQAELKAGEQYLKELDYAEKNWWNPELQRTAKILQEGYKDRLELLKASGIEVKEEEGFDPQRYDASAISPRSFLGKMWKEEAKILGTKTFDQRTYHSYYEAFSKGPFIPVTRDAASIAGHYMSRTGRTLARDQWKTELKILKAADGQPLAVDAIQSSGGGFRPHKPGYEVVYTGGKPLSVHPDYASRVRRLADWKGIEDIPWQRAALHFTQQLKHSLLVGDIFHLFRMLYYTSAIKQQMPTYKSGWSVLDFAKQDLPEAVAKGFIRQKDLDWANARVPYGKGTLSRHALAEKFYSEMGANMGRIQDALYMDLVTKLSPAAGRIRKGFVTAMDPTVGRYNRFLFNKMTRGIMAETNVREFERQMRKNPNANPDAIMRDIARDTNNFFGNIGRQGWFKSKTEQDLARLTFLAPQWVEGLIKKEVIGPLRFTGISKLAGARKGLDPLGTMGRGIGTGLLFMTALTQAINLITRRQPTWMNEEKEHKFDAWVPGFGADSQGFWFSPMSVFNEMTHDAWRLSQSKENFAEAMAQIAGNKESPVMRAVMIALTGIDPLGRKITTTPGRIGAVGKALVPMPISFSKAGQALGHQLLPGQISPSAPGAVQRQLVASAGIKIEPAETAVQRAAKMAREFMQKEGLTKETGWQQIQTDQPGYTKLRSAIRNEDWKEAKRNLEELRKTRTDNQIGDAMKIWAKRGFTGSSKTERELINSLNDQELRTYDKAQEEKQALYEKFADWFWAQD